MDLDTISDVDESEIDKMILKPEERDFKTRVWNNLNKEWLEDQQERKRKKKEMKKKQKTYEIITNSS